jgi:hypothetical protein
MWKWIVLPMFLIQKFEAGCLSTEPTYCCVNIQKQDQHQIKQDAKFDFSLFGSWNVIHSNESRVLHKQMVAMFDDPRDHRVQTLYEVFLELPASNATSFANNHNDFIFEN